MKNLFISSLALVALLTGCDNGECCQAGDLPLIENKIDKRGNITPIANFEDLKIKKDGSNCSFSANGSKSIDEDGDIVSYIWSINDIDTSTSINPLEISIPCPVTSFDPIVCLSVTDNEEAKSLGKCKAVKITETPPIETKSEQELIEPTAIISFTEIESGRAFLFNCESSYDNDNIDSDNDSTTDPKVVACSWSVFKTKKDGFIEIPHVQEGFIKWISIDDYSVLHVTLTVTDDDNQTDTITQSYELAP